MMEGVFVNVKNRSKTITAEVTCPRAAATAPSSRRRALRRVVALRQDGVPAYDYNSSACSTRRSPRRRS